MNTRTKHASTKKYDQEWKAWKAICEVLFLTTTLVTKYIMKILNALTMRKSRWRANENSLCWTVVQKYMLQLNNFQKSTALFYAYCSDLLKTYEWFKNIRIWICKILKNWSEARILHVKFRQIISAHCIDYWLTSDIVDLLIDTSGSIKARYSAEI